MDRSILSRLRRCAVGAAFLGALTLPGLALADAQLDGLGNDGNIGSGPAFQPQTRHTLVTNGGAGIQLDGVEVAGLQVGDPEMLVLSTNPLLTDEDLIPFDFTRGTEEMADGDTLVLRGDVPAADEVRVHLPSSLLDAATVPAGALVVANGTFDEGIF